MTPPTNTRPQNWNYLRIGRNEDERQEANLRAHKVLLRNKLTQAAAPGLANTAALRGVQDYRRKNGPEPRRTTQIRRLARVAQAQGGPDAVRENLVVLAQKAKTTPEVFLDVLSRPPPRFLGEEVLDAVQGQGPSPEDKAIERSRNLRLWQALSEGTPAQQRAAHGVLAGWEISEIAELEGVSCSAVLHRLRGLKKIMTRYGVTL